MILLLLLCTRIGLAQQLLDLSLLLLGCLLIRAYCSSYRSTFGASSLVARTKSRVIADGAARTKRRATAGASTIAAADERCSTHLSATAGTTWEVRDCLFWSRLSPRHSSSVHQSEIDRQINGNTVADETALSTHNTSVKPRRNRNSAGDWTDTHLLSRVLSRVSRPIVDPMRSTMHTIDGTRAIATVLECGARAGCADSGVACSRSPTHPGVR